MNPSSAEIKWAVVLAIFAGFLAIGIYVVSGRWAADQPKRDARAIERWEKARRAGFFIFALRGSVQWFFVFYFAQAFSKAWRLTHSFAISTEEIVDASLMAAAVGSVVAIADWFLARRRAEEAHERAGRLQDERHS